MLRYKYDSDIEYPADCNRIKAVLAIHNVNLSVMACQELWKKYSDRYAAGWMILPDTDDELFLECCKMLTEDNSSDNGEGDGTGD